MNKASNRAKRLAGMFGAVDPNELAKQAEAEKSDKSTSRPMTTAPTKALQASFASIEEENLRLKAELEKSKTIELDPVTVRASIIQDRLDWTDEDPDFQSLVSSIREEGQRLPILVRPHPTESGQYQLAYGARRNRACMVLGQKVKAYVQDLSDEELVIAQGLENNERKNLSFIEQAVYAVALMEAGFTRKLVAKSVGVATDTTISKMSAIVALVPADIFRLIGPAPKIGRNRWEAFASLAERSAKKPSILEAVRALPESAVWKGADSNKRFELAYRTAEKADKFRTTKPRAEKSRLENEGRSFGTMEQTSNGVKIFLDAKKEPAFAQFVADKMTVLIEEFKKGEGKQASK
jgi:ParB family chromosome partitioning protein